MSVNGKTITHSWADVAEFYRKYARDPVRAGATPRSAITDISHSWRDASWSGATVDEVIAWLDEGYDFPQGSAPNMPVSLDGEGPRWRWNDEDGDYEHELFLAGESDYYLDRRQEPGRPGVYVRAEVWMSCGTDATVIEKYGAWVGAAIQSIQAQGFDVALAVTATVDNLYNSRGGKTDQTIIQVTRFGEQLMARDYAALFSRAGIRHLVFAAQSKAEIDDPRIKVGHSQGVARSSAAWNVEWDEDSRVLYFGCQQRSPERFPEDDMTAMLREIQDRL